MDEKIVYLMRGLPSCGKSHTAHKLTSNSGVVLETDQYFYTQVGDDPASYDYSAELLSVAREWNYERFQRAIAAGFSPIVVDRGNGLNPESYQYARYAVDHGYRCELKEPESEWWQEKERKGEGERKRDGAKESRSFVLLACDWNSRQVGVCDPLTILCWAPILLLSIS